MKEITIERARVHNLKAFTISIPKNKLVVATGVSGSGKSSLVFDIIFEEGRKQYLQSLGVLPGMADQNKFDSIVGLAPTIAVKQNIIRQSNPRSTVGSRTNILNMLALLYAADGKIHCSVCHSPVDKNLVCRKCKTQQERLDASYFSYNAPNGMCTKCLGRGASYEINMDILAPNKDTTVQQIFDALEVTPGYRNLLHRHFSDYLTSPFYKLPEETKDDIIFGQYAGNNFQQRTICLTRTFQARIDKFGQDPSGIYTISQCSECQGARIGAEARSVLLDGKHIGDMGLMSLDEARVHVESLLNKDELSAFGVSLANKIKHKLGKQIKSRLGHLSLYREMPTLSGGEIQRLFINMHLDSEMDSLIYILDEPTVGLHESEKSELIDSIVALKEIGNTVIVVEHDKSTIEKADHIIDIGPKAGIEGGDLVYQGSFEGLLKSRTSITGQYLSGRTPMPRRIKKNIDLDVKRSKESSGKRIVFNKNQRCLTLHNCKTNNLKNVSVSIPLGLLVGIAGVSGSGKSSLISNTLIPLLKKHFQDDMGKYSLEVEDDAADTAETDSDVLDIISTIGKLEGVEYISGVAIVSQAPIGRNMNSNPATYIGIWDKIRKLFAAQPEAKKRKLTAGHFSFNSKGACETCGGSGFETVRLGRDLEIYNTCGDCNGRRYNEEALSISYKGRNIFDVLSMRVSEAVEFFDEVEDIASTLRIMNRIGMGYIGLGQPTPSLSGGEAQRIKLAKEIGRRRKGNILYVLDEPTTGLSLYDTAKLISLLDELITKGNSVIVIEHDTAVLESCDWLIEMGPIGGVGGGKLIAEGTPEDMMKNPQSITGKYINAV